MTGPREESKRVVMLVDNRRRDLPAATLMAYQLEQEGVTCHLEPLEAYQGVLAAHRPHLIIFNHLTAFHLEQYSKRLAQMGVKTAVLLNEGILYDEGTMKFNAGKFHNKAHIDFYYCWNEPHRQALIAEGFGETTTIEVVGVPRFDFYKRPWSRIFESTETGTPRKRPQVLVCSNFVCSKFGDLPKEEGDKFFAAWADRIPLYADYWKSIKSQHRSRAKFFDFLDALVAANEFDIVLRPHPNEAHPLYHEWYARQSAATKEYVTLDLKTNVTTRILGCDLEISCETCTTAIEAWIAGKPTVELTFEKNPLWYHEEHGVANVACGDPAEFVDTVRQQLADFDPASPPPARVEHLRKWCSNIEGTSCQTFAKAVARGLKDVSEPDWSQLTGSDRRRALKLRLMQALGFPYHFNPFLPIKAMLRPQKYAIKKFAYGKSIRPKDVSEMRHKIEATLSESTSSP